MYLILVIKKKNSLFFFLFFVHFDKIKKKNIHSPSSLLTGIGTPSLLCFNDCFFLGRREKNVKTRACISPIFGLFYFAIKTA